MSLEDTESFTSNQITSAIKSCRNNRAFGPDSLSIFHFNNLGPLATEHLTALYNDSLLYCRLPSIWKTSLVIPIPKPGKDSSQGTLIDPSHCYVQRPRSSRRTSYSLSTNCYHQLNINTDSDTQLHLPSSRLARTSKHVLTSGNHLIGRCVWPSS